MIILSENVLTKTDEITIEEIVIDSIIDKIAGDGAVPDKIAGDEAIRDKRAGGAREIEERAGGAQETDEVIAEEADKAVELVDPEVVTEPFIENLEDPEAAKSREKYYQFDCRTAGEEAKLYLRLTPKNLMRLLPKKLIKLSN